MVICPNPHKWHEIFQTLDCAWKKSGEIGSPPPTPLILAGWAYSNDLEKKDRWEETIRWARNQKLDYLLNNLTDEDMYSVDNQSNYTVGPMGGPMYLPWDFTPKPIPSEADNKHALQLLVERWPQIVGTELAKEKTTYSFCQHKSKPTLGRLD